METDPISKMLCSSEYRMIKRERKTPSVIPPKLDV
jgi:hypothetical protein